eukprot:TRINITY_DN3610_c0_g1_i4.p1 TRINITY_DN3610_c0_g1~~TRINITY_DN3610_c0_g1_i4.p1  ORF type:complete len:393 (+),score=53.13 TRINITY_DN3610_c0_g1_i4:200-1378(+)
MTCPLFQHLRSCPKSLIQYILHVRKKDNLVLHSFIIFPCYFLLILASIIIRGSLYLNYARHPRGLNNCPNSGNPFQQESGWGCCSSEAVVSTQSTGNRYCHIYDKSPMEGQLKSPIEGQLKSPIEGQLKEELTCPLCMELFFEPVTLHCGHTFCLECIGRALDTQKHCPVCRTTVHITSGLGVNLTLSNIVKRIFPSDCEARSKERILLPSWLPLFVLNTVLLPGETLNPLHIYEPRYRLMVRRCLQGSGEFGVIMFDTRVGTLAVIQESRALDDGRYYLKILGKRRFQVEEVETMDGYYIARVSWVDDFPEEHDMSIISTSSELSKEFDPVHITRAQEGQPGPTQLYNLSMLLSTHPSLNNYQRQLVFSPFSFKKKGEGVSFSGGDLGAWG